MSWNLAFDELEEIVRDNIALATVKMANDVVSETRKYSGQLRASVNYSLGTTDLSKISVENYTRNAIQNISSSQNARFTVGSQKFKIGQTIIISNNQPYARVAEYKFGDRMFGKAVQRFRL